MPVNKPNVLFLCTGNSCRSQMAEGFARHLKSDRMNAFSAGIECHGLNENAVAVMAEKGVDISSHTSKVVEELGQIEFDYVVTVCGHANETCPMFRGDCKVIHVGFNDPPQMALAFEDKEQKLECYRKVRDEIEVFIKTLPDNLPGYTEKGND
ncbi:arsenate reductase ArsC [Desulfosediminicola sp.]|uniref:arsenate reductase ArsC n=1 Tax=Desulfosediminicola sp. TaxID=2886825 RepID=UPI003AF270B4